MIVSNQSMVIAILMLLLVIRLYSDDRFDCTNQEEDSLHPVYNTSDCRHYWHCIYVGTGYERAVKRKCPAGTKFDVRLRQCEISSLVHCKLISSIGTFKPRFNTIQYIPSVNLIKSSRKSKILPKASLPSTTTLSFEKLVKYLNAIALHSTSYSTKYEVSSLQSQIIDSLSTSITRITTTTTITNDVYLTSKKHRRHRRRTMKINILTSDEHKIRQFSLNQTHGLLIHCNEIRRRRLRDIIFGTTATTKSVIILNSSLKNVHYDILSLKIFIISFLFLQKISD